MSVNIKASTCDRSWCEEGGVWPPPTRLGAICTRRVDDGAECQSPAAVGITEEPSGSVYALFATHTHTHTSVKCVNDCKWPRSVCPQRVFPSHTLSLVCFITCLYLFFSSRHKGQQLPPLIELINNIYICTGGLDRLWLVSTVMLSLTVSLEPFC